MNFTFTGAGGIAVIDGKEIKIKNIKLDLNINKSYIYFEFTNNLSAQKLSLDIKKLSFEASNGYKILIPTAIWFEKTSNISAYIDGGREVISENYKLKCVFIEFTAEKNCHNNQDCDMELFISNHNFKNDFTIHLDAIDIKFSSANSCFIFPRSKAYKNESTRANYDIFNIIQNVYALYYGKYFRLTHTEFKGSNYHKIHGNINEGFELFNNAHNYYFLNQSLTSFPAFLQNIYDTFKTNQDKWRLNLLIKYYLLFTTSRFLQIQFLLLSVFMEALKYSFGKNISKIPEVNKGQFLKPQKFLLSLFKRKRELYSFAEMLDMVYKYLNISGGQTSFIMKRNDVVHSGDIPQLTSFDIIPVENQVREIIAKLVGFNGEIYQRDMSGGKYK